MSHSIHSAHAGHYAEPPAGHFVAPVTASAAVDHNENHPVAEGHMGHEMGGHAMAFHFGSSETILFNFWRIETAIGVILSCIAIIAICFLLEFVRWFRLYRKQQRLSGETDSLQDASSHPNAAGLAGDGALHAVQLTLSYALMLVFMSFNVWLCAAVVSGEVAARTLFAVLFPRFERLRDALAAAETCCG